MKRRRLSALAVLVVVLGALPAILSGTLPSPAYADTITVNSNDDVDDGACDSSHCSLREAINASNASAGVKDTISFSIGSGPQTITPGSGGLPAITDPVIIDGTTQLCATYPCVEIDGASAGASADGLHISAGNSTVQGLVINRFGGDGIELATNGGDFIQGSFIGTDVTGTADLGNSLRGVLVYAVSNNTIGGAEPGTGNVISGNDSAGIYIGGGATGNQVLGNLIGTDITGTADLGNSLHGVFISGSPNNSIGGTTPEAGNVVSGNDSSGVYIAGGGSTGNQVLGNLIGTQVDGTSPLGNADHGLSIWGGATSNAIGGTADGAGNTIASNGGDGVYVAAGTGNPVRSNLIFSNTGLGIDLGTDGVTGNDTGDGDSGGNNLQNFPVLTSAISGSITIQGTLNSKSATTFTLEFFSNTACDPSGNGEGETFIGSATVVTDGSGNASFTESFPTTVPPGHYVTASTTDPSGNTSEFSACRIVAAPDPTPTSTPTVTSTPTPTATPTPTLTRTSTPTPTGTVCGGDADGDGVPDGADNCPLVYNPGQQNADAAMDNGPGISGDDATVPNVTPDSEGDACETDGDADNDGLPDSQDTNPLGATGICAAFAGTTDGHPSPAGGDVTDDDNHNGDPALAMGADASDNGPSWDTDNDGAPDGVECTLGTNPRERTERPSMADCGGAADTDGDGLQNAWETCGWGTDFTVVDSDGDTHGDCKEAADVDGNGTVDFVGDVIYYAKAGLLPSASFGKTMDFDINKNGLVDFVGDVIQEAKFALITGLCQ